jgi:betaine reductase
MPLRVVHYLNQFFGGIGGEEANDHPVETRDGAVGPARALAAALAAEGVVVATVIAGDNYLIENEAPALAAIQAELVARRPDVVFAGPAFDAGRYGVACALVCKLAAELGIPSVTGMHPENAGVLTYGRDLVAVPTGANPAEMVAVLRRMWAIGRKLGRGEPLGPADVEGYLPTGRRSPIVRERPGAQRAVDMVLARVLGQPFASEVSVPEWDVVAAPPPIDPAAVEVALVTTAGLVPRGNPDGQTNGLPRKLVRYSVEGMEELTTDRWESVHGGFKGLIYNTVNPSYALPLPALRDLARRGVIGGVHREFFSVVGASCPVGDARRMGREIARALKDGGVGAVLLEST